MSKPNDSQSKRWPKVLLAFFAGAGSHIVYEVIEEMLEEAIVWGITTLAARALSFILVVFLTQTVKWSAKAITKALFMVLKPVIKKLIYKEGNDKTQKILRILRRILKMDEKEILEEVAKKVDFKAVFNKIISFLKRNKKSNLSTIANVITALVSGAATVIGFFYGKVDIPEWSVYLIGSIAAVIMFALVELGVVGKGYETQEEYDERKAKEVAKKQEEKELAERHAKEIAAAEEIKAALALEMREEEARRAAEEARRLEVERQIAEAEEQRARIDKINQIKINYQIAVQNGFEGDINAYIDSQIK